MPKPGTLQPKTRDRAPKKARLSSKIGESVHNRPVRHAKGTTVYLASIRIDRLIRGRKWAVGKLDGTVKYVLAYRKHGYWRAFHIASTSAECRSVLCEVAEREPTLDL